MKPPMRSVLFAVFLVSLVIPILRAQVSNDRLLRSADEPRNWMMYSGTYASQRYSTLSQINPSNVKNLEQKWIFQAESLEKFETTPLVVDGIMYITQAPSDALALDAKTGRVFWIYRYYPSTDARPCCGSVNRGLAILGDTLFLDPRCAPCRTGREDRPAHLEYQGCECKRRICYDGCATGREGQGHRRRGRRRVRHSRIYCRL